MLVVFDMDGTLTDSGRRVPEAMGSAFRTAGLTVPSDADIMATVGVQPVDMISILVKGLSVATINTMADHYETEMTSLRMADPCGEKPFPDATAMLKMLHQQGVTLGIATGKGQAALDAILSVLDWHDYFQTFQSGEVGPGKPHPAQLLAAMSAVGAPPQHTIMIGDTNFDMEMAKRAGIKGIGVTWGYHSRQQLEVAGACAIVDSFHDLGGVIQEMMRASEAGVQ